MGWKICRLYPADLLVIVELKIPGEMGDAISQQIDLAIGVPMGTATDKSAHGDVDAELLPQFPPQADLGSLAFLELPAGELPFVGLAIPSFAAGNENFALSSDDGGCDRDPFIV